MDAFAAECPDDDQQAPLRAQFQGHMAKKIETLTHADASRTNIPAAEREPVMRDVKDGKADPAAEFLHDRR